MNNNIITPLITERSMRDAQTNKFTFKFLTSVNKGMIKKIIQDKFLVDVVSVYTTTVKGRSSKVGKRRVEKKTEPWKKAIVTLKEGQKIGIFDASEK